MKAQNVLLSALILMNARHELPLSFCGKGQVLSPVSALLMVAGQSHFSCLDSSFYRSVFSRYHLDLAALESPSLYSQLVSLSLLTLAS